VLPGDTETTLHDRIKIVERELLIQAVLDIATNTVNLKELVRT
jgi:phosphoribosylglycinamide formyltransferase-1